jgi:hypothetical protein
LFRKANTIFGGEPCGASETEPLLRLTVEGESLKAAREILKKGVVLVKRLVGEMEK